MLAHQHNTSISYAPPPPHSHPPSTLHLRWQQQAAAAAGTDFFVWFWDCYFLGVEHFFSFVSTNSLKFSRSMDIYYFSHY
jgi:hypothetical protein